MQGIFTMIVFQTQCYSKNKKKCSRKFFQNMFLWGKLATSFGIRLKFSKIPKEITNFEIVSQTLKKQIFEKVFGTHCSFSELHRIFKTIIVDAVILCQTIIVRVLVLIKYKKMIWFKLLINLFQKHFIFILLFQKSYSFVNIKN